MDEYPLSTQNNASPVERRLQLVDLVLRHAIEHLTRDGTLEEKLTLRSLMYHGLILLDAENSDLKGANDEHGNTGRDAEEDVVRRGIDESGKGQDSAVHE